MTTKLAVSRAAPRFLLDILALLAPTPIPSTTTWSWSHECRPPAPPGWAAPSVTGRSAVQPALPAPGDDPTVTVGASPHWYWTFNSPTMPFDAPNLEQCHGAERLTSTAAAA